MAGDPAFTEEELEMKTSAVRSALVGIGHDTIAAASDKELRDIIDRDVLPKVAQLFKIQVPPTGLVLDMDFVDKLDQGAKAFREAKSDKPGGKSTYDSLAKAKAEGRLTIVQYDGLDALNFGYGEAKLLDDETYKTLKALPPEYVNKLEGLFDLVEKPKGPGEPDKFKDFTDDLRILIKAGKIGVKPKEEPAAAASAASQTAAQQPPVTPAPASPAFAEAPAAASDSTQPPAATSPPPAAEQPPAVQSPASPPSPTASAAEGGISPPSDPVTGGAPTQPAPAPAPAAAAPQAAEKPSAEPPLKEFDTPAEASKWAEVYLAAFAKANNTIPAPAPANSVFDDASKASAWSTIILIKKGLGIEPADGVYNVGVHDLIAGKLDAQSASDFRATLAGYLHTDKTEGDRKLRQFLAAMKKLSAVPGTLLDAPPPPPKVGILDGFKQSIQETRDMMAQFLGDEKATSILRMVFGFIAQFLGPILGRFGINIGPIFSAIGMDEFLDEDGNISPEKTNEAMQKIYLDAARQFPDDPAKLKEEVLKQYKEEMKKGGLFIRFANLFTDEEARIKALEDSLDAAAAKQGLSVEERAKIFANVAQGKGEAAKAEASASVDTGSSGAAPKYEQPRPTQPEAPPPPRDEQRQPPPPPAPPPKRGGPAPAETRAEVDIRALGGVLVGKDDPGYQMVAGAFGGAPSDRVVSAVQDVNILIGRYEHGELKVYNVNENRALAALTENQSAGSKMIAESQLVTNAQSNAKAVELFGNFHSAARERYSFDTNNTHEGRMKLRDLVQKQKDTAYLLRTQYAGVLLKKAYGDTGQHVANPMSGPYKSKPNQDGVPVFHEKGLAERVLGGSFGTAAGTADTPTIIRRSSTLQDAFGESTHGRGPKVTEFQRNRPSVEGVAPTPPEDNNDYDLRSTHAAAAEMERGR